MPFNIYVQPMCVLQTWETKFLAENFPKRHCYVVVSCRKSCSWQENWKFPELWADNNRQLGWSFLPWHVGGGWARWGVEKKLASEAFCKTGKEKRRGGEFWNINRNMYIYIYIYIFIYRWVWGCGRVCLCACVCVSVVSVSVCVCLNIMYMMHSPSTCVCHHRKQRKLLKKAIPMCLFCACVCNCARVFV